MPMILGQSSKKNTILQVENIESRIPEPALPSDVLSSLLPTQLQAPSQCFLEETEITSVIKQAPQPTYVQKAQKKVPTVKEIAIAEADDDDLSHIPAEEKAKTIKCLLKVLNY